MASVLGISTLTSGQMLGSVAFIAPEVFTKEVKEGKEMKVDVYSYVISMILYDCCWKYHCCIIDMQ